MTPEESVTFCQAASMGIACGLSHRYEWYYNACRALVHGDYERLEAAHERLDNAFIAFEKMTASCPEEAEELEKLNENSFIDLINKWYNTKKD